MTKRSEQQSSRGYASKKVGVQGKRVVETHPLTLSLAVLLGWLTLGAAIFWTEVREYYLYFTTPRVALSFNFQELSDNWGEAELKSFFEGADLFCLKNEDVALGDRRCYLDINAYNDAPAMGIGFFLSNGKLQYASVNVPIWAHGKMHDTVTQHHGASSFYSGRMGAEPLDIWRLPGGSSLFMSRDPARHLVKWHQLFWASDRVCKELGC